MQIKASEVGILRKGRNVEVDIAVNHVGVPAVDEPRDHSNHLGDVLSSPAHHCRSPDAYQVRMAEELGLVAASYVPGRPPLTTRRDLHFVVASIGVRL